MTPRDRPEAAAEGWAAGSVLVGAAGPAGAGAVSTPTRGRACTGKVPHCSQRDAEAQRQSLIVGGACPARLRVYRCPHAPAKTPHWHVGHTPRRGAQR